MGYFARHTDIEIAHCAEIGRIVGPGVGGELGVHLVVVHLPLKRVRRPNHRVVWGYGHCVFVPGGTVRCQLSLPANTDISDNVIITSGIVISKIDHNIGGFAGAWDRGGHHRLYIRHNLIVDYDERAHHSHPPVVQISTVATVSDAFEQCVAVRIRLINQQIILTGTVRQACSGVPVSDSIQQTGGVDHNRTLVAPQRVRVPLHNTRHVRDLLAG